MTSDEAKEAYRQAWMGWRLTQDPERKRKLEQQMDAVQPIITPRPGPEWDEFTKSLPGFLEFWQGWHEKTVSNYAELKGIELPKSS